LKTKRIDSPEEAAKLIRAGGIVAFPTETVFGLGVDATNEDAVRRLYIAKGRPSDNPLIVHLSDAGLWKSAAAELPNSAKSLLEAFSPGPITVVLAKSSKIGSLVSAGLNTVGIRIPDHSIAHTILKHAGVPVAAPSANRSGRPSGTTWQSVLEDLDGRIDGIFCQDSPSLGIESTVVDCTSPVPTVLRLGAVTLEQIRSIIPDTQELTPTAQGQTTPARPSMSPGLAHPHYQPKAQVILIPSQTQDFQKHEIKKQNGSNAYCGLTSPPNLDFDYCQTYLTIHDYAAAFYEFLREADRRSIQTIYIEAAPAKGIGRALLDRQQRAAAKK
jgi:L-threonylcarbamoyladenylate synthase